MSRAHRSRREVLLGAAGMTAVEIMGLTHGQAATLDADIASLADVLTAKGWGSVMRPDDPDYGRFKYYYHNGRFDCVTTTTYLRPTSTDGVQHIVAWAAANNRRFAIRGAGHSFEGKSSHPELVIDMSDMKQLDLAPDGTLHVGAGTQLGDVYERLVPEGRLAPGGTCPSVGIVGHALGGGIGDMLPMLGYAAQSVLEFTIVTFEGHVLRVTDAEVQRLGGPEIGSPPLAADHVMRVLRGAGQGSIGIVTALKLRTFDVTTFRMASFKYGGIDDLPVAKAISVLETWQNWRKAQSKEIKTCVSSKVNLRRSSKGFDLEIAGLYMIPPDIGFDPIGDTALIAKAVRWRNKAFNDRIDARGVLVSFMDDAETTNNTRRKREYGASSVLPNALSKTALTRLIADMPENVDVSFYTSGGNCNAAPTTSLHASEFLIEWVAEDRRTYDRVRALNASVAALAGFGNFALPSYPDPEPRNYFANTDQVEALRARFDAARLSTSSLLDEPDKASSTCP